MIIFPVFGSVSRDYRCMCVRQSVTGVFLRHRSPANRVATSRNGAAKT